MPQSKLSFLISFRFIYPKCAWLQLYELIIEIIINRLGATKALVCLLWMDSSTPKHKLYQHIHRQHDENYRFSWLVCTAIFFSIENHNFSSRAKVHLVSRAVYVFVCVSVCVSISFSTIATKIYLYKICKATCILRSTTNSPIVFPIVANYVHRACTLYRIIWLIKSS